MSFRLSKVGLAVSPLQSNATLYPWKLTASRAKNHVGHVEEHNEVSLPLPELEVRPSSGKGSGLFAVDRIPAFTRILEDEALLSLIKGEDLPQLWEKYCALPNELKQQFNELSFPEEQAAKESDLIQKLESRGYGNEEAKYMARVCSRYMANAFKTTAGDSGFAAAIDSTSGRQWTSALFPLLARINHSCTSNALAHFRPASGSQVVYSLRDIGPGEEIEAAYFDLTMPYRDRQARAEAWRFRCRCPACAGVGEKFRGSEYEQRLALVHRRIPVEDGISTYQPSVGVAVDEIWTAISIASSGEYPWLVAALPRLYHSLGVSQKHKNIHNGRGQDALEKALEWECRVSGIDSPSAMERRHTLKHSIKDVEDK